MKILRRGTKIENKNKNILIVQWSDKRLTEFKKRLYSIKKFYIAFVKHNRKLSTGITEFRITEFRFVGQTIVLFGTL